MTGTLVSLALLAAAVVLAKLALWPLGKLFNAASRALDEMAGRL